MEDIPQVDFVGNGEVDLLLPCYVKGLLDGDEVYHPSVNSRTNPAMANNPAIISDLSELPVPAFDLVQPALELYSRISGYLGQIPFSLRTSAGCIFACRYCAGVPSWHNLRFRSAQRLSADLESFRRHIGGQGRIVFLEDELFTVNKVHVSQVAEVISSSGDKLLGFYTEASQLSDMQIAELSTLSESVVFGIEGVFEADTGKREKGQSLAMIDDMIAKCMRGGLNVQLEYAIGLPNSSLRDTIKAIAYLYQKLLCRQIWRANTYVFCPHPGTAYGENPHEYGLVINCGPEWMLESGGYPTSTTKYYSANTAYILYLLSQSLIQEAYHSVSMRCGRGPDLESIELLILGRLGEIS
ncbi:hypothetical protein [Synechococcus sp. BO 8801]|uniref:B12-binding domain-containing radical SAM protein n=1 Tax=Synechococcus sp. BO 8801 TaxID=169670 RepID=UPI001E577119|nr:hypothetical protein [Synechococcus sp. BO 8801]